MGIMPTVTCCVRVEPSTPAQESVYIVCWSIGPDVSFPVLVSHLSPFVPVTVQEFTKSALHVTFTVSSDRTRSGRAERAPVGAGGGRHALAEQPYSHVETSVLTHLPAEGIR